jgi:uncharacterized protein (DUF433 family)
MAEAVQAITYIAKTPGFRDGEPHFAGRHLAVEVVVYAVITNGLSAEEAARHFDLTLAQVYAALSYYYDHAREIQAIWAEQEAVGARLPAPPPGDLNRWNRKLGQIRAATRDPDREMTVPEIAAEFGITPQAVREAAAKGWITARKAGRDWLIRRGDALARWQKPSGSAR